MRSEGILYARCGDLELRLEPGPPAVRQAEPTMDIAPVDAEQRDLETLLYSSGVEAEPFLRALQRGRAA